MAEIIIMPKLGFNMDEGQLVKWHKKQGDKVSKGEVLFEINTDKTTMPVEATIDGVVLKIILEEGEFAPVFTPIAVIGNQGENPDSVLADEAKVSSTEPVVEEKTEEDIKVSANTSSNSYDFDITVIGGGPGGYVAAIKAAQEGKKTCIVESTHFGGVCLNEGCIPTKTLIKTANIYEEIKEAENFAIEGLDISKVIVSMTKLQNRKNAVVNQLVNGVKGLLIGNKVTVIEGKAAFVDHHTIAVGDKKITSENFIIATGSHSFMPPFIEQEGNTNIITSKAALELDDVPKTMAIIGGGVIGIEFAYLLNKLGTEVTVLELMENILPMVDAEVASMAQKRLEKDGIKFKMGAKVKKVQDSKVIFEVKGVENHVEADVVLMAVGRTPNTEGLNAEGIGIEFDRKAIKTDLQLKTNIDNIYAIGDVNGKVMLAHTASHEGIIAVENICGKNIQMNYDQIPSCIYLEPEIACIGMTEAQAKEKYTNVKIGKFPMIGNGKSLVEGDTEGIVKVIIDGELGEILGVHMYGKHTTDMIAEIAVAMKLEATAEEIIETIHPHPTVSESIPEAFMAAFGKAIHFL
ncbi:dihydrolipoyl dehydrogenase [Clostridiaceae bacterium 35-E11]